MTMLKIWENFEARYLAEFYEVCVQSDTLILADVFETFRNKSIEIYKLDPAGLVYWHPGLACQASLKKRQK